MMCFKGEYFFGAFLWVTEQFLYKFVILCYCREERCSVS